MWLSLMVSEAKSNAQLAGSSMFPSLKPKWLDMCEVSVVSELDALAYANCAHCLDGKRPAAQAPNCIS